MMQDNILVEHSLHAYSELTVRRAQIVWHYLGEQNKFTEVCNIYHHLELQEEKMSEEERSASLLHEYNLFFYAPPKSTFLFHNFPSLYPPLTNFKRKSRYDYIRATTDFSAISGVTKEDIIEASLLIRTYCKGQCKTMDTFQKEFSQFLKVCGLNATNVNLKKHIRNKLLSDDIDLHFNYARVAFEITEIISQKVNKYKIKKRNINKNNTMTKALQHANKDAAIYKKNMPKITNGSKF